MIIYQASKSEFLHHALRDDIEDVVSRQYRGATGHGVGPSEIQAWKHSLLEMAKVLGDDEIPADAGVAIETAELAALHHWAEVCGGGGKPSGAGGGDCGVAIVFGDEKLEGLEAAWRRVGLEPLRLSVSDAGVRVIRIISET